MKRLVSRKLYKIISKELSENKDVVFIVIDNFKDGMYGYFGWKGTVIKSLDKQGDIKPCFNLDNNIFNIFHRKYISIDYVTRYNIDNHFTTTATTILPDLETKDYFNFYTQFIKDVETKLPVKVLGFSYYSSISFHWLNEDGVTYDPYSYCIMKFNILYKFVYGKSPIFR